MPFINLNNLRQELLETETYLGDPDLLNHVEWVPDRRQDIVAMKPETGTATTSSARLDSEPALLSSTVRIWDQSFRLTSDVSWRGPTESTKHLQDAKASCVGVIRQS